MPENIDDASAITIKKPAMVTEVTLDAPYPSQRNQNDVYRESFELYRMGGVNKGIEQNSGPFTAALSEQIRHAAMRNIPQNGPRT